MQKNRLKIIKTTHITIKVLAVLIIILSAMAYHTPNSILNEVYAFEQHHFFLFGLTSCFGFFTFLELYQSLFKKEGLLNKKITNLKRTIIEHELGMEKKNIMKGFDISEAKVILKEEIPKLTFDKNDLPIHRDELSELEINLKKAMVLGNSYKQKVKVFFKDMVALRYVETTVWFVGEQHVTLKEGINIPKNQIFKVII